MQVSHTVRLTGANQYEMEHFTFMLSLEDIPHNLKTECTLVQVFRIMEYVVQRELINLQLQSNHMDLTTAQNKIEHLRQCLGPLSEKLAPHGL